MWSIVIFASGLSLVVGMTISPGGDDPAIRWTSLVSAITFLLLSGWLYLRLRDGRICDRPSVRWSALAALLADGGRDQLLEASREFSQASEHLQFAVQVNR